jgi:acetyl-CoA carboxylase biotin carboxyl carrier protein
MTKIVASMAGSMWKILVKEGDEVKQGQDVAILESMKMEIPIAAETDGIVKKIHIQEGDFVNDEDVLIDIE